MAHLVKTAPCHFIVAGRPRTKEYQAELEKAAEGLSNIDFIMQFLDDDLITALIQEADALLLPYDTASSLNSGTAILSFSNKRTVLCPNIGTLQDLPPDIYYTYEYENADEHLHKLHDILQRLQTGSIAHIKQELEIKGLAAYNQFQKSNSKEVVTNRYRQLLEKLNLTR